MADRRRPPVKIQAGSEAARARKGAAPPPRYRQKRGGPVGFEEDDSDQEERVPVRFVQPVSLEDGHAHFLSSRDEEILRAKRRAILEEARNREADADETVDDFNMYSEYDEDLAWRLRQARK
jgi:hypothetical protein